MRVLVLVAMAFTLPAQTSEYAEFVEQWNEVGVLWNESAIDMNRGIYPREKFKRLNRAIDRLRRHPLWSKE
jgi:hypothetical protein